MIRLLLISFINLTLLSQTAVKDDIQLGFNSGFSSFHKIDLLASPLIYKNTGFSGSIDLNIEHNRSIHLAEVSFEASKLLCGLPNFNAYNYKASLRYNYLLYIFKTKLFSGNNRLYVGGGFYSSLNYTKYNEYISISGVINTTWYWSHSLELSLINKLQFTNSAICASFSISILSNIARPSYSYVPGTYAAERLKLFGTMGSFLNNVLINSSVSYDLRIFKFLNFGLQYHFEYTRYNKPRKIAFFSNSFMLKYFINL